MSIRALVVLSFAALLAACSSDAPQPQQAPNTPKAVSKTVSVGPLPAYQREISGTLLGVPAGAQVELALLVIDDRGRPQQLLASSTMDGNGQALPFQLRFNPEVFPSGARVELRGRASQSGQLILHLRPLPVARAETQATGQLQFEKAP